MKSQGIRVTELLDQIPQSVFDSIGLEHKVDYKAKKLAGQQVFQLLLYGLLSGKELSLRILEELYESPIFQSLSSWSDAKTIDHSSLAERLSTIKIEYFKGIFEHVSNNFASKFSSEEIKKYRLVRFDSTMISLSAKLLKMDGLRTGDHKRDVKTGNSNLNIKFSVGFDGTTVRQIELFNEQTSLSENVALPAVIEKTAMTKRDIAVFDKGITRRKAYSQFSEEGIQFVTRVRAMQDGDKRQFRYQQVRELTCIEPEKPLITDTLMIEEDLEVHLFNDKHTKTKQTFRLIKATILENGERINFLTNILTLSAEEVTEIYRLRWDIEVFFKFLKQEFDFKHFLSRNENGVRVMMYMTAIAAMLIYTYRKLNRIEGFKIAKLRFINELEREIIQIIVELCQGKPQLFRTLYVLKE